MELLLPDTAQTLARYNHPHWSTYAAITGNHYGQGYAVYLGCHIDSGLLKDLLRFVCTRAGVTLPREQYPVILIHAAVDQEWGVSAARCATRVLD